MRGSPWIGVALVLLILFIRKPDAFLNPQFWAEDGSIFFTQQVLLGIRAHDEPYAGYFNEVPRLVASLAALLPHLYAPALYNGAALLVLAGLVWKLYSPRLGLPCPLAFALAVALVPHVGGEVFVSLANVQWILALLLLAVALQRSPETPAQAAGDAVLVLLTGLTGPFIFFALPLLAWKAWRHRSRLDLPVLIVAAGAAAVQVWALSHSSIEAPPPTPAEPGTWSRILGQRLIGSAFLGIEIAYALHPGFLIAAGLLLLAGILWTLRRSPEHLERAGLSLLFAAAILAGMCVKFSAAPGLLIPPGAGARYFFIPYVVLAWCLLLTFAASRGAPRALAATALLAMLAASLTSGFRSPALEDLRWADHAGRIGGPEAEVWIPINPQGWMIHIPQ
jgi:hypothetical protein